MLNSEELKPFNFSESIKSDSEIFKDSIFIKNNKTIINNYKKEGYKNDEESKDENIIEKKYIDEILRENKVNIKEENKVEWQDVRFSFNIAQIIYIHAAANIKVFSQSTLKIFNSQFNFYFNNNEENNNLMNNIIVEVYNDSSIIIKNSVFRKEGCVALFVRNNSMCYCDSCIFEECSGLVLSKDSYAYMKNCVFRNNRGRSMSVLGNSRIILENCIFENCSVDNRLINVEGNSIIEMVNCNIKECRHGLFINSSKLLCSGCNMSDITNSCIILRNNSIVELNNCNIKDIRGNGIFCENSSGVISHCTFNKTGHPSLLVRGLYSNPLVDNCKFYNEDVNCVSTKLCSRVLFKDCYFECGGIYSIIASDLAMPALINCSFTSKNKNILVCDFARVYLNNLNILNNSVDEKSGGKIYNDINECEGYGRLATSDIEKNTSFAKNINYNKFCSIEDLLIYKELSDRRLPFLDISRLQIKKGYAEGGKINLPCGHINNDEVDSGKCGVCSLKVEKSVAPLDKLNECVICKSEKVNCIIIPCTHCCLCCRCALKVFSEFNKCPICSCSIQNIKFCLK